MSQPNSLHSYTWQNNLVAADCIQTVCAGVLEQSGYPDLDTLITDTKALNADPRDGSGLGIKDWLAVPDQQVIVIPFLS